MQAIHQNLSTQYQLPRLVYQSLILKSTSYRRGKKFISGYNIFPATVYCIGYLIDTGLIQGFSQTWSKPRETQKIYCSGVFTGLCLPRILHMHKHYATLS